MKRIVIAAILGLLATFVLVLPGSAAIRWCATDPIVRLDGVEYQVIVAVPEENVPQVNGPLYFVISSPEGTSQELLFTDAGYNGYGETVVFTQHQFSRHTVLLNVPHTGRSFPVVMTIYQDGQLVASVRGTSLATWASIPVE